MSNRFDLETDGNSYHSTIPPQRFSCLLSGTSTCEKGADVEEESIYDFVPFSFTGSVLGHQTRSDQKSWKILPQEFRL